MQAASTYAPAWVDADISGTVGYSRCEGGSGSAPCAFYLGSLHLELDEHLEIELTCNGAAQQHELTSLTIDLAQPAFGISEEGTSWNSLPPGGLVLVASGVVDEVPFESRRAIAQPVFFEASDGLIEFDGTNGFKLDFEVPCNGEIADLEVWWTVYDSSTVEGPPTLGIDHLPSTISCPDELALTLEWANDPEEDYASLRWIVDGVLLEDEWPTISFTESHQVTAVLRDERGATGTASKTISCL
jgi:hypothetical protein